MAIFDLLRCEIRCFAIRPVGALDRHRGAFSFGVRGTRLLGCQLSGQKGLFGTLGKCKPALILQGLHTAFQADDEGSIPFTRSKLSQWLRLRTPTGENWESSSSF